MKQNYEDNLEKKLLAEERVVDEDLNIYSLKHYNTNNNEELIFRKYSMGGNIEKESIAYGNNLSEFYKSMKIQIGYEKPKPEFKYWCPT